MSKDKDEIIRELYEYERNMSYDYLPGADGFMKDLHARGIPMAIVTSSNDAKMVNVRRAHPELWELTEAVLTSEHFSKSKPDPESIIKGMEILGGRPEDTYVSSGRPPRTSMPLRKHSGSGFDFEKCSLVRTASVSSHSSG